MRPPRTDMLTRRLVIVLLVLIMWAALLGSLRHTSATYDEHEYISRGYLNLKSDDTRLLLRHPILLDNLSAAPLIILPDIELLDDPAIEDGNFHLYANNFLWQANAGSADLIIWLARLPRIAIALILAAAVFAWANGRFGYAAGLVALILCVFDPNLLAHGRLATPDVGQTVFIFMATYLWWRYWQRPSKGRGLATAVLLGLALAAGFPALLLVPVFGIIAVAGGQPYEDWRALKRPLLAWLSVNAAAFITLWSVYRFDFGELPGLSVSVPAPYYWAELGDLIQRLGRQDLAYLGGEVYRGGRPLFFVVALIIKTPIPTLILSIAGLTTLFVRRRAARDVALWLLPILYFVFSLASSLNIGYRHLLPILPFLFVLAGSTIVLTKTRSVRLAIGAGVAWVVVSSLWIQPYYLAYFNLLGGGPIEGKKHLVVSDLDWGQDLGGLGDFLAQNGNPEVYLSYFGTAPPERHGIRYRQLPSWPPRGDPERYPFHPSYPLPGLYAISAANLQGARFENDPDTYKFFRQREPAANVGYSIYLYEVQLLIDDKAAPANLVLSGVTLPDLPAALFERWFHTNDLRPRWVDGQNGVVIPDGQFSLVLPACDALHPLLASRIEIESKQKMKMGSSGSSFCVYSIDGSAIAPADSLTGLSPIYGSTELVPEIPDAIPATYPIRLGDIIELLGFEIVRPHGGDGYQLTVASYWRIVQPSDRPLAFFLHMLDRDGGIVAQHDGVSITADSWQAGDLLIQLHPLALPQDAVESSDWLQLGLYDTETMDRIAVEGGSLSGQQRMLLPLKPIEPLP
ncbi:MAG: glycosyltransferase family 39 protein [Chloroflexota bacterium]|nr:MAG: glycosyltransferase family 39 protein [Chloroflexota bacterium]